MNKNKAASKLGKSSWKKRNPALKTSEYMRNLIKKRWEKRRKSDRIRVLD